MDLDDILDKMGCDKEQMIILVDIPNIVRLEFMLGQWPFNVLAVLLGLLYLKNNVQIEYRLSGSASAQAADIKKSKVRHKDEVTIG